MTAGTTRLLALDAVRGLAAVSVVLIHAGLTFNHPELARFGYLGVDLFFIMSGFVISRAYDDRLRSGLSWQRFMLLRLARLYPSMLLGLLVGILAHFAIPASVYPIGLMPGGTYEPGWHSLGHFFLVPDLTAREGLFPFNGVLWSLFFELAMNVVHGITVRRLTNSRLSVFVVLAAILWAITASKAGRWGWGGGWNGPTFFGGFLRVGWAYATGILLNRTLTARLRVSAIVPVALTALVLLAPNFGHVTPRITISLFVVCPLIVALAARADLPPAARGVAAWIGAISYPLYATHHPLLLIIAYRFELSGITGLMLAAAAAVLAATVVEYTFDAPLRRRWTAWVQPRTAGAATEPTISA